MEIIPKVGIGPLHFGMNPDQVRALFAEEETYEDWMGGNLNDFGCALKNDSVRACPCHS